MVRALFGLGAQVEGSEASHEKEHFLAFLRFCFSPRPAFLGIHSRGYHRLSRIFCAKKKNKGGFRSFDTSVIKCAINVVLYV